MKAVDGHHEEAPDEDRGAGVDDRTSCEFERFGLVTSGFDSLNSNVI